MKLPNSIRTTVFPAFLIATLLTTSCASPGKGTAVGATAGAAGGAGIGSLIGGGRGALIGAGIGAATGGFLGNRMDKQAVELSKVAETKRTDDGIIVSLKNDVLFETGKANVSEMARAQLAQLGAVLAKYPTNHITVEGHTDSVGNAVFNQTLSLNRANAVQNALFQSGVAQGQIVAQGYGQSRPVDSNATAAGRAKNRRVEMFIVDTQPQQPAKK